MQTKTADDNEHGVRQVYPDNGEVGNDPGGLASSGLASSGLADRGAAWLAKGWLAARKQV